MSEAAAEPLAPVEPVAVLPSSLVPSSKADEATTPSAPKPKPPAPAPLSPLARADGAIAHLQRCMQTRAGADTVLMFACYAARLSGDALELGGRAALRTSSRRLVAALFALPPAMTVVLDAGAAASAVMPPAVRAVLSAAARLRAFSGMVSEMRTMGRLWGLLGLYSALKGLAAKTFATAAGGARRSTKGEEKEGGGGNDDDDAAERLFAALLAWAQVLSLIGYQACENAAYLGSKKILPIKPPRQGRLAVLSVRFWGAYVAMELVKHLVERARRLSASSSGGGAGVAKKKKKRTAEEDREWLEGWRKAFWRNAAWAPLTMHWGTPGGLLPDVLVSLLATYPATGGMRDLWRSTA